MLLCLVPFAALPLAAPSGRSLSGEYKQWLDQEVLYIISDREREQFLELESDEQRQDFIRRFWEIRDPDPSTEVNEYRQEHARRIEYANQRFHDGVAGWKSERGRIYIMHGPPDDISFVFGGKNLQIDIDNPTEILAAGQTFDRRRQFRIEFVRPESEIWVYRHLDGARSNPGYFQVVFSRVDPMQLYQLNQILRKIGDGLNAPYAARVSRDSAIMNFLNSQRMGGPHRILYAGEYRYPDVETLYQSAFHPNRTPVLSITDLQQGLRDLERSPGEILEEKLQRQRRLRQQVEARISFENFELELHFAAIRSESGTTQLPVTVGIDAGFAGDQLDLLLELAAEDGRPVASVVDTLKLESRHQASGEPFLYQTRLAARPGRYTLRAYGFLNAKGSVSFREYPVELPDFAGRDLRMSDVLLFDKVLSRTGAKSQEESRFLGDSSPIYLKDFVLVPAADNRFRRREKLTAFFEVYNPGIADGAQEPALDVKCRLWQGARVVADVSRTRLDYVTVSHNRKGTRRTSYGLSIPLQRLHPGEYALELAVHDPVLGQDVSRKASFWIY